MKKIIALFVLLAFLLTPALVFAQTTTVRTRVGNPPTSNDVLGVAQDLKGAYDKCGGGSTVDVPGLGECLKNDLLSRGYSQSIVSAFEARRMNSLAIQPPFNPCTQCLGFVALALLLLSGSNTLYQFSAADVYPLSSFTAGAMTFTKIPSGTPFLPGDIGVHNAGDYGHIVIVNQPMGNVKFTALESNGNRDCRVSDSRQINSDPYVFFRMQ